VGVGQQARENASGVRVPASREPAQAAASPGGRESAPGEPHDPTGGAARDRELAGLRREVAGLRDELARLRESLQHTDGELGFAMLTAGRLRGRLEREVEAREALERRLAECGLVVLPEQPAQSSLSRSRRAAARSGTRSFLTDVDT
jgi:hypothetical protein